jgi:NADH:ubiquinone oxidoreductase subunit 5 (subunit L)/multisubunit Na+/H+ antiporter MnhA subunit
MSRQVFMVFYGESRIGSDRPVEVEVAADADAPVPAAVADAAVAAGAGDAHDPHGSHGDPHESPWTMTVPLVVLAVLAAFGGLINLPFHGWEFLADWLRPVVGPYEADVTVSAVGKVVLAADATISGLAGIGVGYLVYLRHRLRPVEPDLLLHAYHYDEALAVVVGDGGTQVAEALAFADKAGIDGAVNGTGTLMQAAGRRLRVLQTGYVRSYALAIAGGAAAALVWFVIRAGV